MTDAEVMSLSQDTVKEIDAMRTFCRWAIRNSAFDGCDLDGGDVQEQATKLGLLTPTTATKEMANSELFGDCEPGDTVFVFAGPLKT